MRDNLGFALDAKHRTLARRFQEPGYATGGAVSAYVLRRATGSPTASRSGTTRSRWAPGSRRSATCSATAPSRPRRSRAWSRRRAAAASSPFSTSTSRTRPTRRPSSTASTPIPTTGRWPTRTSWSAGSWRGCGARASTTGRVVAVTSDHGEGLLDHGEQEHGFFLYREALQVPLVLRLPGGRKAGTRVAGVAGHADLAATLLDLAGCRPTGMDGASLRAAIDERPHASRGRSTPRPSTRATTSAGASCSRRPRTATASSARRGASSTTGARPARAAGPRGDRGRGGAAMGSWLEQKARPGVRRARRRLGRGARGARSARLRGRRRSRYRGRGLHASRPQGQAGRLRDVPAGDAAAPAGPRRRGARGPARGGRGQPRAARRVAGPRDELRAARARARGDRGFRRDRPAGSRRTPRRTSPSRGSTASPAGATAPRSTRGSPPRRSPAAASRRWPRSASTRSARPRRPPTRARAWRPSPTA